MNRLDSVEKTQLRNNIPDFQPGDTVRVHVRIKESETKERLQAFEGVVIARKHGGARETITVRKTSFGIGVERIFPLHATIVDHIDVVKRGHDSSVRTLLTNWSESDLAHRNRCAFRRS